MRTGSHETQGVKTGCDLGLIDEITRGRPAVLAAPMHTRAADDAIASVIVGVEGLDESGTSTVDGLHGDVGVVE